MKLFGFNIGGNKKQSLVQNIPQSQVLPFAFSTPFMNIGSGNLSMPYVNKFYTTNNIVRFGSDNLYPQLLVQMYYQSALHGSIIDFITNSIIGGGYSWDDEKLSGKDKIEQLTFEKMNKFKKMAKLLTRDYIIHRRICVKVTRKEGQKTKLKRIDPSFIRNSVDLETFVYSSDWSRGLIDTKLFKRYSVDCQDEETLYVYQDETPGQDVYPIPSYNSILNWTFLDGETSYFHKSNIQNAVFPSLIIRRPKDFSSIDEMDKFKQEISTKTGAQNAGRIMVLTGNGFDDVPQFDQVSANDNDKLFEVTAKELKDQICFGHSINPSIAGIKVAGSLGNSEEIKFSYSIFEKNVVMPNRNTMEEILNDLVDICKIPNSITINNFQIIEDKIVDVTK